MIILYNRYDWMVLTHLTMQNTVKSIRELNTFHISVTIELNVSLI